MAERSLLCESHDRRVEALEKAASDFASHTAAEEYRFQIISDQISQLGKQVTESIDSLGKRVDGLAVQTAEHHDYLRKLMDDREVSLARKKKFRKISIGLTMAAGAAMAEQFGTSVWEWIKGLSHG